MMKKISVSELKTRLSESAEMAFLDVREAGQYGEGHPFFSVNTPYSLLESRVAVLVPRKSTPCVLMDGGDGVAERAVHVLAQLGYSALAILSGGIDAWTSAGHTLFKGVNVPSKTFGELVEHELQVSSMPAEQLHSLQTQGKAVIILDGRGPAEFHKMSVPGAKSCPNAELAYRISAMVPDDKTPVVVNCAGRTRSIIGASTLQLLDVPNPVYALENGTQGWRLAGYDLAHGADPGSLPAPDQAGLARARDQANELIARYRLPTTDPDEVRGWQQDPNRTTYLFDVRTAGEFVAAHLPGAVHAPGGQLVQATDEQVAVRGARIVLSCDTRLRAATTALWLRGMGHQAFVLNADASKGAERGHTDEPALALETVSLSEVSVALRAGVVVLDASSGLAYRQAHVEGARWVTRARLGALDLPAAARVLVTGSNLHLIAGVVRDLRAEGFACQGTAAATAQRWRDAGLNVLASPGLPADDDCIDYLFFVHDRHDGNLQAARQYLAWEQGLVGQLDSQERAVLKVPAKIPC